MLVELAPGFRIVKCRAREGRPPVPADKIIMAMSLLDANYTYKQAAAMAGIGVSTLRRYRKKYKARRLKEETESLYDIGVVAI